MEINPPLVAGPSTFRPTPALGVTYVLDTEEEDIKPIIPLLPGVDDVNDKDYDPNEDQDIGEDDSEERFPYPTPSSVVHGKRKVTEIYDVDEETLYRLRGKKTRLESARKEPECIYISSDSEDDVVQIPQAAEKKKKRLGRPPKQPIAPSEPKSKQSSAASPDEKSASPGPDPEAEMGSVERQRPDAPNWVEIHLAQLWKEHPSAKLEICYHYSIEGDVWRIKCKTCPRTCSVGPGQSLGYLSKHLKGAQHQAVVGNLNLRSAGPPSNAARNAKAMPRREPSPPSAPIHEHDCVVVPASAASNGRLGEFEKAAEQDRGGDVERFLDQIRLPAGLAPKLRAFGLDSDERMSQIGGLSDESLGVLLDRLTERAGVDMAAAIIIREGLKRRAGTL